jgi:hypothetical protein
MMGRKSFLASSSFIVSTATPNLGRSETRGIFKNYASTTNWATLSSLLPTGTKFVLTRPRYVTPKTRSERLNLMGIQSCSTMRELVFFALATSTMTQMSLSI